MEPFKPFHQIAQENAIKVTSQFLDNFKELDAVAVVFVWKDGSADLPNGVFLPRKDKFSGQIVFRFMDAVNAVQKYLFSSLIKGLKSHEQQHQQRQQLPHPPLHHAERPSDDGGHRSEVYDRGDHQGSEHSA
jgi:hypothetical protein